MDYSALTTIDLETLQTWLSEAISARHQLATGKQSVRIEWLDHRMQYTQANLGDLAEYIQQLQGAIRAKENGRPRNVPLVIGF